MLRFNFETTNMNTTDTGVLSLVLGVQGAGSGIEGGR